MATDVRVPDIGDYQDVPVIEILVKDGERVEKDASLITLESEKATMEVPAPEAGVVRGIRVKVGDKLNPGDVILALELDSATPADNTTEDVGRDYRPDDRRQGIADLQPEAEKPKQPEPPPAAKPAATSSTIAVTVPDIGDYDGVPVIEILVGDGDAVEKEAPLIVLESEKATMEVPAPESGIVRGLKVKVGDKLSMGAAICDLETTAQSSVTSPPRGEVGAKAPGEGAAPESPSPPAPLPQQGEGSKTSAATPWDAQKGQLPHASPAIRKLAREFGVDLSKVKGSGRKERITKEDVQAFVKRGLEAGGASGGSGVPAMPAVDFSKWGEIESKPLARIRKISAQYLHRAWLNIPHVTQTDNADITELENFRKEQNALAAKSGGPKLTLLPFVVKAVAAALREFPDFNSSLAPDGESLILKKYCHVGFAADTPNGLVVPVVKDVWTKGIAQLATECGELAKKARDGKLKPDEMKGGCFSISSLGGIGGSHFTPIVNAPEVGILGVSRSSMQPLWNGKEFQPRLMCPLSLSYDHRVIDGAYAARFIVQLTGLLSDLRRLAL